jgi:hypothetical protein
MNYDQSGLVRFARQWLSKEIVMRGRLRSGVMIVAVVAAACATVLTGAGGALAGTHVAIGAQPAALGGTWGTAEQIPGTTAGSVFSVSCPTAGYCTAGGGDTDGAFAARELNGTWQSAVQIPGVAADAGQVNSLSCRTAGNCTAGGEYVSGPDQSQAFVADEVKGKWQTSIEVPGIATLDQGPFADVGSVSCGAAGDCSAGGYYTDSSGTRQAFVADEVAGTWQDAFELPGTALAGGDWVESVSCPAVGDCTAGGQGGSAGAFVADEVKGIWQAAIPVPGIAALEDSFAQTASVSCAAVGYCTAGGSYTNGGSTSEPFVASEVKGTWQDAIELPGIAALGPGAEILSVSCAAASDCSAGGGYTVNLGAPAQQQAFVASEVKGTWQDAIEVPRTATLNQGVDAVVNSVSCGAVGNCGVGGYYTAKNDFTEAFVTDEVDGRWRDAITVPDSAHLNKSFAQTLSVSCAAAGNCTAGGHVDPGEQEPFVANETS